MLSSIVKEHQAKQAVKREDLEKKRKIAVVAASNLTSALVDHLNVGVAQAYLNQKRLDHESKELHVNVTNFAKQTAQWLQLVENFSQVLKEIGDVENWAKSIENDMQTISSALEYAYKEPSRFVWKKRPAQRAKCANHAINELSKELGIFNKASKWVMKKPNISCNKDDALNFVL